MKAGERYGRLVALEEIRRGKWRFRCDCGGEIAAPISYVERGSIRTCGCGTSSLGRRRVRHGRYLTPEYRAWQNMRNRCNNPNDKNYDRYGGRGIKVCDRWDASFDDFFADVGQRPSPEHSLDRYPDNDGDYEPNNVRWALQTEQTRNRENNRVITFRGKEITMAEACEVSGLPRKTIERRLSLGWDVERALAEPIVRRPRRT